MPLILPLEGRVPRIAPDAFIAGNATIIGDVTIGAGASIWFGCILRGDGNPIHVGARTNVQDGTIIHISRRNGGTFIGDNVLIGHMAMIHACTIEDGAFVGMTACVLDGAVVEAGAMVAAGALISPNKRVPGGELWAGRPARLMRRITETERADIVENVAHYCELAQEYRALKPSPQG